MMNKSNQTMYRLLRELGNVHGIATMTILALNSFIESIRQLKCSKKETVPLYFELANALKNSQPNIIPLMHLLEQFENEMQASLTSEMDLETRRQKTIEILQRKIELFQSNADRVTENGLNYINDNDVIIVHAASSVVTSILVQAKKKLNRCFKVIILENNPERTRQTVRALREADIEHIVAPAHNLSHYIEGANKMFVGALTITSDHKIVAPTGTAGTVSLCHLNKISVHLFANSLHYSHRDSSHQEIYQEQEETHSANINFNMTTHSHDLVDLELIDHIITETGEIEKGTYPV
jgi:translation initiation factor 2B subunit (eIF-2B alpha/beta/delta family)